MCIFHKWGKWEQYEAKSLALPYFDPEKKETRFAQRSIELRQKRVCITCGKMQDIKIKNLL